MIIVEAADDTTEEERKADGSDAASDAAAQERLTDTFTHLSSDMQELYYGLGTWKLANITAII